MTGELLVPRGTSDRGPASGRELTGLLAELVAIDSVNPTLVPGGAGEGRLADHVASWLARAGARVRTQAVAPGRHNVIATAPGRSSGPAVALCGHMDTVGCDGAADLLVPRIEGSRMFGRGAYDMKAGLAAAMACVAAAVRDPLAGDLVLAAVVDEEDRSLGARALLREERYDAVIVCEPTGASLDVGVAHKGFAWIEVEVEGRAAHGSRADLGRDAIVAAAPAIAELAAVEGELRAAAPHRLLGHGSVHAGTVAGGQEVSSYPARCTFTVERRTLPGERPEEEGRALGQRLCGAAVGAVAARSRVLFGAPAFEAPAGDPVVAALDAACRDAGVHPRHVGSAGWNETALFADAGMPTALFGPGGANAHGPDEWVDLDQLAACARILWSASRTLAAAPASSSTLRVVP